MANPSQVTPMKMEPQAGPKLPVPRATPQATLWAVSSSNLLSKGYFKVLPLLLLLLLLPYYLVLERGFVRLGRVKKP